MGKFLPSSKWCAHCSKYTLDYKWYIVKSPGGITHYASRFGNTLYTVCGGHEITFMWEVGK